MTHLPGDYYLPTKGSLSQEAHSAPRQGAAASRRAAEFLQALPTLAPGRRVQLDDRAAGEEHLAVRAERHVMGGALVAQGRAEGLERHRIPQPDAVLGRVTGGGEGFAVRAEGHGPEAVLLAQGFTARLARGRVPQP